MTVKEIVRNYLQARNYDGLCNPDTGCGCVLSDFAPCDCECLECLAAVRIDKSKCKDPECEFCPELGYHIEEAP